MAGCKIQYCFYHAFFLQDSRFTGEISFESLTDDEKIQIVVPKRVISPNPFAKLFGMSDEEIAVMEKGDREKLNSEEHLRNTFGGNAYSFKEFVSLLIMKYEKIINSEHIIKLSNDFISTTQNINTELSVSQAVRFKKAGRPLLEKIEIVKPKERGKGDKKTISEKEDAGKLFCYLAQLRFILTDDATSKDNMSKSIQGLTGFSAKQIEDSLLYEGIKPKNLKEARKIVENIKNLIIKCLEKNWGG